MVVDVAVGREEEDRELGKREDDDRLRVGVEEDEALKRLRPSTTALRSDDCSSPPASEDVSADMAMVAVT